jgi:hypothetical protein
LVGPAKNSTRVTLPSGSDAVAAKGMEAGATKRAPAAGLVKATPGARFEIVTVVLAGAEAARPSSTTRVTVKVPTVK